MKNYDDSYRHKGLRKKLVEVLKEKGITSIAVLEAIHFPYLFPISYHFFLRLIIVFDKPQCRAAI